MVTMDTLKTTQEVVHEGWLIKSPPTKLWRARWRKRWFALRHSGELPGQYFLEYFTDKRCRKLKGRIDLDQCEQVDSGLRFENRKQKYHHMFNVKTPKREYFLVAENEADMNKWVDAVCQVCGLKAYTNDEEQAIYPFEGQESPPISPASTISGPYIPISECISGRHPTDNISLNSALSHGHEHYDAFRRMASSPPRSPTTTDAESVFTDEESSVPCPLFPGDPEPSTWSVTKRFSKLRTKDTGTSSSEPAPPRPPKPSHMLPENPGHNYLNLDGATESSKPTTPATPAPPSTPGTEESKKEPEKKPRQIHPKIVEDQVFTFNYDFHEHEPPSPRWDGSSTATYSNLPSPLMKDATTPAVPHVMIQPPPIVHRELKPRRKTSGSLTNISNEPSPGGMVHSMVELSSAEHSPAEPPSINRKLKPSLNKSPLEVSGPLQLASPPGKGRLRAAPSPTPPANLFHRQSTSDEDNVQEKEEIYYYQERDTFIPASAKRLVVLQYLDLDLKTTENFSTPTLSTSQPSSSSTVYKTVDFLKTEAFNRTRQRVEAERKQCTDELI